MPDPRRWTAPIAALLLALVGCEEGKGERGLRYMPDMAESSAYKAQEAMVVPPEVDAEGEPVAPPQHVPAMLEPVPGTLPRDFVPYDLPDTQAGLEAARELVNPLAPTPAVLRLGQDRYNVFCAVCHGRTGNKDDGYVAGRVAGILSIDTENVASMPDGQIYHIISNGRGRMPDYRAQLLPDERWAVIHYVRALGLAAREDLQEELRAREAAGARTRFPPREEPVPGYERGRWPQGRKRPEEIPQ